MSDRNREEQYEKMFAHYVSHVVDTHERNRRKIRTGLKVNLILPWLFLFISFITDRSKLFFLILWILSLFGIAFYLMYVEYSDYKMQRVLGDMDSEEEIPDEAGEALSQDALTGRRMEQLETRVTDRMDRLEQRLEFIDRHMEELLVEAARRVAARQDREEEKYKEGRDE